jgi:hypothetical protein
MLRPSFRLLTVCVAAATIAALAVPSLATPYASNVTKTGTTVSFILNENTDSLKYTINGGAPVSIANTTKGTKTFNLTSATDKFSIIADKTAAAGYSIPDGTQNTSLAIPSNQGGLSLLSDDASPFSMYNAPRGVGVSNNPNSGTFGTVYISNGAAGTVGTRNIGDGLYALNADQTDKFGYGDTAQNPLAQDGFAAFSTTSSSSPYRLTVAPNGEVYVTDFADSNSNLFRLSSDLTSATYLFQGLTGPAVLPPGQNHGSTAAVYVEGSAATNNLVVYTIDEDLTTAQVTGSGDTADQYSLWKYNLGSGPFPSSVMPTKVLGPLNTAPTLPEDLDRGADGKFYMSVNAAAATTKLVVADASGNILWNSLTASQAAPINSATDILIGLNDIAVSPDQKWLAGLLNFSDTVVIPLVNGLPDLANRLVVDSGAVNSARDVAFDAADNIYIVTSGDQRYRVFEPGGHTISTLTWDGTTYSFATSTVGGGVPGDYNGNGVVDMADYVLWRNGGPLQNEGASTGVTDAADYDFWRAHFGNHAGSGSGLGGSAAVPEPTSAVLMLLASMLAFGTRRGSR